MDPDRLKRVFYKLKQAFSALRAAPSFNCVQDATTRFYDTGSVINNRGDRNAIRIGANTHVRGEILTFSHGGDIAVGDNGYIGEQTRIWSAQKIHIGDRVLISHLVSIFDSLTHPLDAKARHQQFKAITSTGHPLEIDLDEKPVRIEDDAWIGAHSIILPGVTIGKAAVVGAGSVVTKDVEPYTVVAGNPAKFIKKIQPGDE